MRIGQALAMTPEYWPYLQRLYDLDLTRAPVDLGRNRAIGCGELPAKAAGRDSNQSFARRLPMLRESSTEKPSER